MLLQRATATRAGVSADSSERGARSSPHVHRPTRDASAHQPQVLDDPEVVGSSIRKDEA